MSLETIAIYGGLYIPLVFWHFVADWIPQTEKMAESKGHNFWILSLHCAIYTLLFIPIFCLYNLSFAGTITVSIILFTSHFVGDTYLPVYFWLRYIRKMTFSHKYRILQPSEVFEKHEKLSTSLLFRPSLILVIDQLWHLTFLWAIVFLTKI